jgi:hypothetical protein
VASKETAELDLAILEYITMAETEIPKATLGIYTWETFTEAMMVYAIIMRVNP